MTRSKDGLTPSQRDDRILQLLAASDAGMSVRDLVERLGCANDTVQNALARLESGRLVRTRAKSGNRSKANSIRLTESGHARAVALTGPPIASSGVAAGPPVLLEEGASPLTSLGEIIGRHLEDRVVRVTGSSMVEAAVHDGDYLVVYWCPPDDVRDGDMVVTEVSPSGIAEATVKLWQRTATAVRLHPANASGKDLRGRPYRIQEYRPEDVTGIWRIRWIICSHAPRVRMPGA
jgi:SOS-response transcriptional repressor LexA